MINDKFRVQLKSREDGSELIIYPSLTDQRNGLIALPIELDKWEIKKVDQTTGLFDMNKKEIFFGHRVIDKKGNEFEVTINEFTKAVVIDGETGQEELYKCCSRVIIE